MIMNLRTNSVGNTVLLNNCVSKKELPNSENLTRAGNSTNVVKYPFNYNFCAGNIAFTSANIDHSAIFQLLKREMDGFAKMQVLNEGNKIPFSYKVGYQKQINKYTDELKGEILKRKFNVIKDEQKKILWEMVDHDDNTTSNAGRKLAKTMLKCGLLNEQDFSFKRVSSILLSLSCQSDYKRAATLQLVGEIAMHDIPVWRIGTIFKSLDDPNRIVRNCAVKTIGNLVYKDHKDVLNRINPEDFGKIMKDLEPYKYKTESYVIVGALKDLTSKKMVKKGYITEKHLDQLELTMHFARKKASEGDTFLRDSLQKVFDNLVKDNILQKSKDRYYISK